MPSTDFILALVAVIAAWLAFRRSAVAANAAEDAKREAQRRASAVEETLREELDTLRRLMVEQARGGELTDEMIADGRLWRDADGARARELVEEGAHVLDVRTPDETASGVIAGALVIPMDEIERRKHELPRDGAPMVVYCAAGGRSAAVCDFLSRDGFESLYNLDGGFGAWEGATEPHPKT